MDARFSGRRMSKHKRKMSRSDRRAYRKAEKLLRSPRFFNEFLLAMKRDGLVGEEQNALVLFIVVISRLLSRPLNIFVKARSSAGKNFLIKKVLRFLPKHAIAETTSVSEKAWNYMGDRLRHRVVYIHERNDAAGNVQPLRLLISEDKLIRRVTKHIGGKLVTKKYVARGPVASISTSTKRQLEVDDETRHISISVDESAEQTRRIAKAQTWTAAGLSVEELRSWRTVQRILEQRTEAEILPPKWFDKVADRIFVGDLRVRRYYPAFLEACRTVCLIRSFQSRKIRNTARLEVEFADFAIATLIFERAFAESLLLRRGVNESTRDVVARLCTKRGKPVGAKHLARELGIPMDRAYRILRNAEAAGVVRRANEPERRNRKLFTAAPAPRFIPDPERLFRKLNFKDKVRILHPITGEEIVYRPRR
jgi:hypothetical protein